MKILVTGNNGYIGSVLVQKLIERNYEVIGYDINYYKECTLEPVEESFPTIVKDIRDISIRELEGIDAIIHLAGLSNDPLGEFNPNITNEINFNATIKLGQIAKEAGVSRFIYASSQSMYGVSNVDEFLDEDNSEKNPVTAYAAAKWEAEVSLKKLNSNSFTVVCFRPSTVFGVSPRLRCDVVFNNLVACACTTGRHGEPSLNISIDPVVYAHATRLLKTTSHLKRGLTPNTVEGRKQTTVKEFEFNFLRETSASHLAAA
jgi:nucleoside-diphosphate-sugar epimerase